MCFMDKNVILYHDEYHAQTRPTTKIQFPYINPITCTCTPAVPVYLYVQTLMCRTACCSEEETGETGSAFSVI